MSADAPAAPPGGDAPIQPPPAAPSQPATPPPAANPAPVHITSDVLKARLDETREKTRNDVLKEFGFASVSDGKKALAALSDFQKSQMTEQERIAKELADAQARAKGYETRSALFEKMVEGEFNKLPEAARAAIDAQANGNADERYRLIQFMQMAGVAMAPPAPAAPAPPPPPANVGAVPPPPKGAAVRSKLDEFIELQKSRPMAASAFYAKHRAEIEQARGS